MFARWDPGPGRRWPVVSEVAAVVFLVLLRLWTIRGRTVYHGTADEASQLAMARTLSGARPFHVAGATFDAGYALVIAPVYALVEDPVLAFRLVLVVNVVLAVVTLLVLRSLVLQLVDVDGPMATWSAAIALALPGAALQTPYSGSEVLVVLAVALVLLLVVRLGTTDGPWVPLALAVTGGGLVLVHSRLTLVIAVVALAMVVAGVTREVSWPAVGVALAVLVGVAGSSWWFNGWVEDTVWLDQAGASDAARFSALLERLVPRPLLASLAGMTWTQLVTTMGLVVVGVCHVALGAFGSREARPRFGAVERRYASIALILAAAALPAAVFMAGTIDAGKMVYGRYWDALAPPLVAFGVAHLVRLGQSERGRMLSWSTLTVATGGLAFWLVRQDAISAAFEGRGFNNERRIAGLLAYLEVGDVIDVGRVTVLALALLAVTLAVVVVAVRHDRVVAVATLVAATTTLTLTGSAHQNAIGSAFLRWQPAATLVEEGILPDDSRVAFQTNPDVWRQTAFRFPFTAYQYWEPDVEFVATRGDDVLDYDYAVSTLADDLLADQGWEVVFEHPDGRGVAVWQSP